MIRFHGEISGSVNEHVKSLEYKSLSEKELDILRIHDDMEMENIKWIMQLNVDQKRELQ